MTTISGASKTTFDTAACCQVNNRGKLMKIDSPRLFSRFGALSVFGVFTYLFISVDSFPLVYAQDSGRQFDPPVKTVDEKGMDLVNGQVRLSVPLVSFGESATGLKSSFEFSTPYKMEPRSSVLTPMTGLTTDLINEFGYINGATMGQNSGFFRSPMNDYINPDGSRYSQGIGPGQMMRLTPPGGDPYTSPIYDAIGNKLVPYIPVKANNFGEVFNAIEMADGERWTFYRDFVTIPPSGVYGQQSLERMRFAVSSRGYGIQFLYRSDTTPTNYPNSVNWLSPVKVTAYNKARIYCNESLRVECTEASALPSAQVIYNDSTQTVRITEPGSTEGVEIVKSGTNFIVRHSNVPGSSTTYAFSGANDGVTAYVSSITDASGTYNYFYAVDIDDSGYVPYMAARSQNPLGGVRELSGHTLFGQMTSFTDENQRSWWSHVSAHPGNYRVYGYSNPEQGGINLDRDTRNNITYAERIPKVGSGLSPVTIYSAVYPTHCENPRICNRPTSETDARGAVTNYTYDLAHGGMLTQMDPAPVAGAARPLTVRTYVQKYAYVKSSGGTLVAEAAPIWLPATETICQTAAGNGAPVCDGSAPQVVTSYEYGADGTVDNLLLRGVTATAGGQTLRTCYGYDTLGRKISETQPAANLSICP